MCWESVAVQPRSLNKAQMNVYERQMDARNMDQSAHHLLIMRPLIKPQKLLKNKREKIDLYDFYKDTNYESKTVEPRNVL